MKFLSTIVLSVLATTGLLYAQSYQGLEAVKLANALDGDSVSLDPKSSGPLVVVIFTSNTCPYAIKYENRIVELHQDYSQKDIQIFLINPNQGPEDSIEEMRSKARNSAYRFPYLKHDQQVFTDIFGPTRTPEVFLLKPVPNGFELIFTGAFDDNPQAGDDVENHYLRSAIDNSLKGKPLEYSSVRVTGCIIKG